MKLKFLIYFLIFYFVNTAFAGELVIKEVTKLFGANDKNVIYTRVTGSTLKVRLFSESSSGNIFTSGLKSANCEIYRDNSEIYNGKAVEKGFWDNLLNGGKSFEFSADVLSQSGQYSILCSGNDTNGKSIKSETLRFFVAPKEYTAELIITANNKDYNITRTSDSNGNTITANLNGSNFPIIKVGDDIKIRLKGEVKGHKGIDSGVNSSMKQIDETNSIEGETICKSSAPNLPKSNAITINNGTFDSNPNNNLSLSFDDVYKGNITISYTDEEMKSKIASEKSRGGCSGNGTNTGQCPMPPTFKFSFDYLIVPYNFEIKVTTTKNSPINVLYFGQGNSPLNENKINLDLTALDNNNKPLKNFINGCAAIDTELEIKYDNNLVITFIDSNNTNTSDTTTIKKEDWTLQGSEAKASLQRVLSVKQSDKTWTPSMVSEPIYLKNVTRLMYYAGKKDDSSYPQYNNPIFDSFNNAVVLRGRVNMIDTDNASNYSTPTTKVYYEFYCQTCDLNEISKITGVKKYAGSPTSAGWWIDTTFNAATLKTKNISTTNNLQVSDVSSLVNNGVQSISYNNPNNGKYEVTINHGSDANNFPTFLLYKPFYNGSGVVNGETSAFVTIYNKIDDDKKDFGVDTGAGKNTRSGSRTGGF